MGLIPELMKSGRRWTEVEGVAIDEGLRLGGVCGSGISHVDVDIAGDDGRGVVTKIRGEA